MTESDRKILLVEDTLTQAMLYQHMLEKHGFSVMVARSGKQALEQISKDRPAAVITDINMPEMSGYELSKLIKSDDTTSDIVVILLTTTLSEDSIFECINSGADEITLKGLKEEWFVELLNKTASRKVSGTGDGDSWESEVTDTAGVQHVKCSRTQALRMLLSVYDLLRKVQEGYL
ncbi:MAG: response regulator [Candidatus Obscuribacterales bacterium]|nr:response regulator [Candidatus Obscuribacterales bacterium]